MLMARISSKFQIQNASIEIVDCQTPFSWMEMLAHRWVRFVARSAMKLPSESISATFYQIKNHASIKII